MWTRADPVTGQQVSLDTPLDGDPPAAPAGVTTKARSLGAPPDRLALPPHKHASHTLSVVDVAREAYCAKSAEQLAMTLQETFRLSPRLTGRELTQTLGTGPLVDVAQLHGVSDLEAVAERVLQHRRDHHRQVRSYDGLRIGMQAYADVLGRSVKTIAGRWHQLPLQILPAEVIDADGMVSREWAERLTKIMQGLRIHGKKRLSTHEQDQLRRAAHQLYLEIGR